jgi:putative membrane protein
MSIRALALAVSVFGLSLPAFADDSQILSQIHHANQGEIALAQLATSRSLSPPVVDYARQLIRDHQKADKKTLALAKKENIPIKAIPMSAAEKTQMIEDHKNVIYKLTAAEQSTTNPAVKSLIESLLPTLQHHYQVAVNLENREIGTA